jgi:uncharacterized membrane protein
MNKVLKIYARLVLMVVPWFFLPVIYDSFDLGKSGFLFLSGFVGMILWGVGLLIEKKAEVKLSKWFWWVAVLLVWSGVSFWRMSVGGQARSWGSSLGLGGLAGLVMWFFLWLQVRSKEESEKQLVFLSFSGLVVGIISLVVFMIPTSKLPLLWPKDNPLVSITNGWSVAGSLLAEAVMFLWLGVAWLKKLVVKIKNKADFNDYFKEALAVAFFGLMLMLGIYRMVKAGWGYLDLTSAWVIAAETLKNSPIFGIGPGNFVEAFSRFRPASFNMTDAWANTFTTSSVGLLNLWTELGLVGLILVLMMVMMVWRRRKDEGFGEILLLGLVFLLLPPNFLTWFLLVWVMASRWGELATVKLVLPFGERGFNLSQYTRS